MSAHATAFDSDRLVDASLDALWRQWRTIGGAAAGGPARTQVDPEALCMASLVLEPHEPRLWLAMSDWLRLGAPLLSVQRLKNVSKQFAGSERGTRRLAAAAARESRDARWRSLAGGSGRDVRQRQPTRQRSAGPALTAAPALVLRLRSAFSVGVKADLLAFLLGQQFRTTVGSAAASLCYSTPTVFRAFQDLRLAGFVQAAELTAATEYWADTAPWHGIVGGPTAIARWGFWREMLAYVCAVLKLQEGAALHRDTRYAAGVRLRALAGRHEADLARAGVLDPGSALPRSPDLGEWRQFHGRLCQRMAAG
jgi:hypothetical protein